MITETINPTAKEHIMSCDSARKQNLAPEQFVRMGAMAILWNPKTNTVLAGKRVREPVGTWQFPQGGIEAGQKPLTTALVEVCEETGIAVKESDLIIQLPTPYGYRFQRPTKKHGWGQDHFVFIFAYSGPAELNNPDDNEFSELAWMNFADVIVNTAQFRQAQYYEIMRDFIEVMQSVPAQTA